MSKDKMLKQIYKKVSDKSLTFLCKLYNEQTNTFGLVTLANGTDFNWTKDDNEHCVSHFQIIGHPVILSDVLEYVKSKGGYVHFCNLHEDISASELICTIINKWQKTTKAIEEQSIDCITYIYDIIKKQC